MRIVLSAVLLLILCACGTVPVQELPIEDGAVPAVEETPPPADTVPVAPDLCSPNRMQFIAYESKENYTVGLRSLTLEDKGGWYKVVRAEIFTRSPRTYDGMALLQVGPVTGSLMEFNRQMVPVDLERECGWTNITVGIAVRDLTEEKRVTLILGQGLDRMGREFASAETVTDMRQFIE